MHAQGFNRGPSGLLAYLLLYTDASWEQACDLPLPLPLPYAYPTLPKPKPSLTLTLTLTLSPGVRPREARAAGRAPGPA